MTHGDTIYVFLWVEEDRQFLIISILAVCAVFPCSYIVGNG